MPNYDTVDQEKIVPIITELVKKYPKKRVEKEFLILQHISNNIVRTRPVDNIYYHMIWFDDNLTIKKFRFNSYRATNKGWVIPLDELSSDFDIFRS